MPSQRLELEVRIRYGRSGEQSEPSLASIKQQSSADLLRREKSGVQQCHVMFQVVWRHNGPEFYTWSDTVIVRKRGREKESTTSGAKSGLADMQICVSSAELKNRFCSKLEWSCKALAVTESSAWPAAVRQNPSLNKQRSSKRGGARNRFPPSPPLPRRSER